MNVDDDFIQGLLIGMLIAAFIAGMAWMTFPYKEKHYHDEAVKAGHAEYYLDANHDKQFRWKTNCVQIKEKQ